MIFMLNHSHVLPVEYSASHDIDGSSSTLPSKILASDDVHEMDIDGPGVITEVLSDGDELPNTNNDKYSPDDLDSMNRLDVGLDVINEANIDDDLPTEIMDTTSSRHSPSPEAILPHSPAELMEETLPGYDLRCIIWFISLCMRFILVNNSLESLSRNRMTFLLT